MEITKNQGRYGNVIKLEAEGFEARYWEIGEAGSKHVKRYDARVNGYTFDGRGYNAYWKKVGKGGMKSKEQIEQLLKESDGVMFSEGYTFFKGTY